MTDLELLGEHLYDKEVNGEFYSIFEYENELYAIKDGDFGNPIDADYLK